MIHRSFRPGKIYPVKIINVTLKFLLKSENLFFCFTLHTPLLVNTRKKHVIKKKTFIYIFLLVDQYRRVNVKQKSKQKISSPILEEIYKLFFYRIDFTRM